MKVQKSLPIFLILSLLLISGFLYFFASPICVEDCENVFSSEIYSSYHEQMRTFLRKHPFYDKVKNGPGSDYDGQVKLLFDIVEQPILSPQQQRKVHESFVLKLRELLTEVKSVHSEHWESRRIVKDLVRWIFIGSDLNNPIQKFFYQYIEPPNDDLLSSVHDMQAQLKKNERLQGLEQDAENNDAYLHGNLPSVYFTHQTPWRTKVIRMGRPTIQSLRFPWFSPTVSPEFLQFAKDNNHIYVNLTKRHGREGRAGKKIEGLEVKEREFYVITLDKNSDFYNQQKQFKSVENASAFKKIFLEQMNSKSGNYYWSTHLSRNEWHKELEEVVDGVHEKYFHNRDELSRRERKDFIELTYLHILDTLVEKWRPSSMNITCHQGMDRAPSLLVLWMFQKVPASDKELAALLLGPPMMIHSRSSYRSRIERFVSAARRILSLKEYKASQSEDAEVENAAI